jgi:hypothetical protein
MTYPPHLPTVLFSALSSIEGSPGRPRRASVTQTSHTGHRLKIPGTTTRLGRGRLYPRRRRLINLVGVMALAVVIALALVVALGVRLGDAEEGRRDRSDFNLEARPDLALPLAPVKETSRAQGSLVGSAPRVSLVEPRMNE